ncbi:MAG: helix-turn-helix transcriptional regulator [Actinobacteria bacterium]|nr:helix-turn-helix transcriptional regulator [Actinomycetota bacterium]
MTDRLLRALAGDDGQDRAGILDAALGAIAEHVFILDRDFRNVYVNRAGAMAIGKGRSEIVGRTWRELGSRPPEVVDAFEALLAQVFETGRRASETYSVLGPAGLADFLVTLTPIFSGEENRVRYVVDVVTEVERDPSPPAQSTNGPLTSRQREIVTLMARGHTNQEIAALLKISKRTVETHRRDVAKRLGLRSRSAMFRYAETKNWI